MQITQTADINQATSIYAFDKAKEVQENQVLGTIQELDENMQKMAKEEAAAVQGRGVSFDIQA